MDAIHLSEYYVRWERRWGKRCCANDMRARGGFSSLPLVVQVGPPRDQRLPARNCPYFRRLGPTPTPVGHTCLPRLPLLPPPHPIGSPWPRSILQRPSIHPTRCCIHNPGGEGPPVLGEPRGTYYVCQYVPLRGKGPTYLLGDLARTARQGMYVHAGKTFLCRLIRIASRAKKTTPSPPSSHLGDNADHRFRTRSR